MKRINKTTARKLYNEHNDFWITACNMRPECGILIGSTSFEHMTETPFDTMVNSFTCQNCENERGRYPAYYIEDGTREKSLVFSAARLRSWRAEFTIQQVVANFLLDLIAFVQCDENPKNIILGLDKMGFIVYNDGTNKEEDTKNDSH